MGSFFFHFLRSLALNFNYRLSGKRLYTSHKFHLAWFLASASAFGVWCLGRAAFSWVNVLNFEMLCKMSCEWHIHGQRLTEKKGFCRHLSWKRDTNGASNGKVWIRLSAWFSLVSWPFRNTAQANPYTHFTFAAGKYYADKNVFRCKLHSYCEKIKVLESNTTEEKLFIACFVLSCAEGSRQFEEGIE